MLKTTLTLYPNYVCSALLIAKSRGYTTRFKMAAIRSEFLAHFAGQCRNFIINGDKCNAVSEAHFLESGVV